MSGPSPPAPPDQPGSWEQRWHPLRESPRRPGDPPELVADAARFQSETGWTPHHSDLDTIVATAWAWLRRWKEL